jgi:hypothetical protein
MRYSKYGVSVLLNKISDAWLETVKLYFEDNGSPWEWFVYKEHDEESGYTEWGLGSTEASDGGEKIIECESFDQARVLLACMVFGYEIVSGDVIAIEAPEGGYVVGESGEA